MQVGSFLELHTAVLAWHLYDQLWGILLASGLAYLPFIAVLVANLLKARRAADTQDVGVLALRWSELDVYAAFVVLLAAVYPIIEVQPAQVTYLRNSCGEDPGATQRRQESFPLGDSDTSYDDSDGGALIGAMQPRVPLWWLLLNNLSRGLTAAGINSLPCRTDVRRLSAEIESQRVADPGLRDELRRFHRDCWEPSLAEFYRSRPRVPVALRKNIDADLAWAGSQFFLSARGYYDYYRPREALRSFPYDFSRDAAWADPKYGNQGGWPSCRQWWQDSRDGLRPRLMAEVDAAFMKRVRSWTRSALGATSAQAEERVLRSLVDPREFLGAPQPSYNRQPGALGALGQWLRQRLANIGVYLGQPEYQLRIMLVRQAAPVVQALLLMLIIVLLPLLLAAFGYSVRGVVTLSFLMVSIICWEFLFALARWVDNHFFSAMLVAYADARPDPTIEELLLYTGTALFLLLPLLCTLLFTHLALRTTKTLATHATASPSPALPPRNPPPPP